MMACLDTTFLIDLAGGKYKTRAFDKLESLIQQGDSLVTTRFNVAELYVGIVRSDDSVAEERAMQNLLENLVILEFDDKAAWLFGQITAYLQKLGKPAGDMDVLIAATAMAARHSLITRNKSHFVNIPQLSVEEY